MRFKTHNGEIYIPANIIISLIEVLGENQIGIRTNTFIAVVNHSFDEVIEIIRKAKLVYDTTGTI